MVDAGPESTYDENMRVSPWALTLSLRADILHKNCEIGFVKIGNIGISVHQEGWGTVPLRFPTLNKTTGIPSMYTQSVTFEWYYTSICGVVYI